jgi:peptidoglycan/xylan/chitin deacetylase (PgdA/CDA1 family)
VQGLRGIAGLVGLVGLATLALAATVEAGPDAWPNPGSIAPAGSAPEVLFTFDDGPHERYTAEILDTLRERGVQAIFYWVGYRVDRPSKYRDERRKLVARAIAEGHIVGNHTVNHAHLCLGPEPEAIREIDDNRRIYEELTSMPIVMFRAPYGSRCDRLEAMLEERKIDHHHWDIDPQEWEHHDSTFITEHVITKLRTLHGRAVILMHDTTMSSARALPRILDWIDEENRRRDEVGLPAIRILSGSDWVEAHRDTSLLDWADEATRRGGGSFIDAVRRLMPGPLRVARADE